MAPDPLKELLRQADAGAGPPPAMPDDLAARIQRQAVRRRRHPVLFTGAAAAVLLAVVLWWPRESVPTDNPLPEPAGQSGTPTVVRVQDVGHLSRQAEAHLAVAQRLIAMRKEAAAAQAEQAAFEARLATLNAKAAEPDPIIEARKQAEQAAWTLFKHANHLHTKLELAGDAAREYRAVIRLFPTTTWAAVAREELARIENELLKGETL